MRPVNLIFKTLHPTMTAVITNQRIIKKYWLKIKRNNWDKVTGPRSIAVG
jgi:hypothetical protein